WLVLAASLLLARCPGGPECVLGPPPLPVCHGHHACAPHRWHHAAARCEPHAWLPARAGWRCGTRDAEAAWADARRAPPRVAPPPLAPVRPWSASYDAEAHLAAETR